MPIERINFAVPIETRDGTLLKDSKAVNVLFEKAGSSLNIIKRPGITSFATPVATGTPRGVSNLNQNIISVVNDTVYSTTTAAVTTTVGTVDSLSTPMYFAKGPNDSWLFFHDTTNGYELTSAGVLSSITLPTLGTGQQYVPGCVFLDAYCFVGISGAKTTGANGNAIYNCAYQDPTTWNTTQNYVMFEQTTDTLIGIAKHLNYLVAFGKVSTQFYYDAGSYTGPDSSPLGVAQSYTFEIGCASGDSIVSSENTVLWIGKSTSTGRSVYMMDGVSPLRISSSSIDKILERSTLSEVRAFLYKFSGHTCYVLTLHDIDVTIVYDIETKEWVQWTSATDSTGSTESYFKPGFYTSVDLVPYVQYDTTGALYNLSTSSYMDNNTIPINARVVTEIKDSGSTHRKFFGRLEIVGDKQLGSTMSIRHSGDDYRTWSNYRTVDLNSGRPQLYIGAADRRRSWEFLNTSNTPLRLQCAEIDFKIGELDQEQNVGGRG